MASLIAQLVKNPPVMQETLLRVLGSEDPVEKGKSTHSSILGLPCGSAGKESTCNAGTWIQSLGWEDPLEKGKPTHFSTLAYSGQENSMDCIVIRVAKNRT